MHVDLSAHTACTSVESLLNAAEYNPLHSSWSTLGFARQSNELCFFRTALLQPSSGYGKISFQFSVAFCSTYVTITLGYGVASLSYTRSRGPDGRCRGGCDTDPCATHGVAFRHVEHAIAECFPCEGSVAQFRTTASPRFSHFHVSALADAPLNLPETRRTHCRIANFQGDSGAGQTLCGSLREG